jgi:DNA (cytosine-5)-methyltransferase 1
MTFKLIDLFCGAGGMTLGFVSDEFCGGFKSVLGLDNDPASILTHKANFCGDTVVADIEEWLKLTKIPKADLVIGGPPCQGFSLLNKGRLGDERRALWEPYLDVVERSGARAFVMENVAELYNSTEFHQIARRANKLGFELSAKILNAADYGTPQTRKRTIIVGWDRERTIEPIFPPKQTHQKQDANSENGRAAWHTVREVISDLPPIPNGTDIGDTPPLDLHFGRNPTQKSQQRYRAVPEGGNRFDLQKNAPSITPQCWIRKKSGGTDLFGRLWWDRPSVTIRTEFFKPEKGRYLHPEEHRPITHREAARLMGFPDEFIFQGTKIEIARQIGNAVPPALASAIAYTIRDALGSAKLQRAPAHGSKIKAA